jgi:carbamoyl-phosphate synthase large subunit
MKSQLAAGQRLPMSGTVFLSVNDSDKQAILPAARMFAEIGFKIVATGGTAQVLNDNGIKAEKVLKVYEGRPNAADMVINGDIQLMINTVSGKKTVQDSSQLRQTTLLYGVPYTTTVAGAKAMAQAIKELTGTGLDVKSLQEYYS